MSRGQSTQTFNTASNENATDFSNAQKAFGSTEDAVGNYNNQLAKFVSGNPYTKGGEYDQTINTGLANTSDAGANSLAGALQSQALRTGQNSAADAATVASSAAENTRSLMAAEAGAQQQRIAGEAGYNQQALQATAEPITANQSLYSTSTGAGDSALSTEEGAAKTPSFWDEVGNTVAGELGRVGYSPGGGGGVSVGCWIAVELYGGWDDYRVKLLRAWIWGPFSSTWWGGFWAGMYSQYGLRASGWVRRSRIVRKVFKLIFDRALVRAERWTN
jgi:hypothetical protein